MTKLFLPKESLILMMMLAVPEIVASEKNSKPINIGSRLELFVDELLIDSLNGAELRLHHPQPMPIAKAPLIGGGYATIVRDDGKKGVLYRAWYHDYDPDYTLKGRRHRGFGTGGPQDIFRYAESRDGHEWTRPKLNLVPINKDDGTNNAFFKIPPFAHNFSPFIDKNPDAPPEERFKALGGTERPTDFYIKRTQKAGATDAEMKRYGYQPGLAGGLYAFTSPDGIHWKRVGDKPVITVHPDKAFDSQNVAFWSEAEKQYVAYVRTWRNPHTGGKGIKSGLRTISRLTSPDFKTWSKPVPMEPNLPGEHLYTSQTHPYFRAPHIYIATPTRYMPKRGSSTDILFMSSRAGTTRYSRLFKEAFIRPGFSRKRWGNRSNYVACNIVPTGKNEMSIYHSISGIRYVLRTDGFISVHTGHQDGEMRTNPLIFSGDKLLLNLSTSAAGSLQVEIQNSDGKPFPGFTLKDCEPIIGDSIEQEVTWKKKPELSALAGKPVRLRFVMKECDLYSMRFRSSK